MNDAIIDRPERRFQVWTYSVSMARLLLRSTRTDTFRTRIDVLFQDVLALNLPTSLDGLVVSVADAADEVRISNETGLLRSENTTIFTVRTGAFLGHVVAGVCAAHEDNAEFFEPSRLWPD